LQPIATIGSFRIAQTQAMVRVATNKVYG
jgi:hypothetical protein